MFANHRYAFNSDSNTTLRHPDADTSQNASIEAADVPLSRAQSRVRIPGIHRKTQSVSTTFGKSEFGSRPATSLSTTISKDGSMNKIISQTPTGTQVNGINGLNGINGHAYPEVDGYSQGSKTPEKKHWFRRSWHKVAA